MASVLDNLLNAKPRNFFDAGGLIADAILINIGSKLYTGWQSVTVNRDLNALSSSFSLSVADKWRQPSFLNTAITKKLTSLNILEAVKESPKDWPFRPGERIRISIGKETVINGYIDILDTSVSNEDRQINFSGRDKTADIIDSAAIGTRSSYKNITLLSLAKTYANPIDIKVTTDTPDALKLISEVVVEQGETIFELLSRYAKEVGVLLTSTSEGDLLITDRRGIVNTKTTDPDKKSGKKLSKAVGQSKYALQQGVNVLSASSSFDETNRFQRYLVKSQIKGNDHVNAKDSATINGTAVDLDVNRPITKYVIAEKSMTKKGATSKAEWLANIHAIGAVTVEVVVAGWLDPEGKLWKANDIINVDIRFVGISPQLMLVVGVSFSQNQSGTTTTLKLTRVDGYQAQPIEGIDPKKKTTWDNSFFGTDGKVSADTLGFRGA